MYTLIYDDYYVTKVKFNNGVLFTTVSKSDNLIINVQFIKYEKG